MLQDQSTTIKQQLSQIVDMLILNGTLTECPGLIHGKMGLAVFFFHYSRYTENILFSDYALNLMEEIQSQIHANSLADYEKGIAGIGVGIDYLIRNNFLLAEDDICEDLDQRMVRAVWHDPWLDFSLYGGLTGYGRYWISRLHYKSSSILARRCLSYILERIEERLLDISIEEQIDVYCFLYDLQKISGFERCMVLSKKKKWNFQLAGINHPYSRLGNSIVGSTVRAYQRNWYVNGILQEEMDNTLNQIFDLDIERAPINMGLLMGYAGEGLLRLGAINKMNISWMMLL